MARRDVKRRPARSGRATIEDVAAAAGVSRQTVSRAINGSAEIRESTRLKVMTEVDRLSYRPNRVAQGLVTRRTMTAGLVIADIANPFFPDLARGAQDVAEQHGFQILLSSYAANDMNETGPLDALADRGVDGIMLVPSGRHDAAVQSFADGYEELVLINSELGGASAQMVNADLARGGRLVAEHLIARGCRNLGMLISDEPRADERLRVSAFRAAAEDAGLPVIDARAEYATETLEGGEAGAGRLLRRAPEIDGLFCFNDVMGVGALAACRELGVDVPGDCAVAGVDGLLIGELVSPALTSVRLDPYRLGETAMRRLLAMIDGEPAGPPQLLDVSLIPRASTARA